MYHEGTLTPVAVATGVKEPVEVSSIEVVHNDNAPALIGLGNANGDRSPGEPRCWF